VVSNYLTLTKVENTGAFLSLGNSLPQEMKRIILVILPMLALGFAIVYMLTKNNLSNLTLTGICFVVGGGIGNIVDRFLYGSVTDFLHMDFVLFQTGIFNMADVSVMVGVFILFGEYYFRKTNLTIPIFHKKDDIQ
jgi:signal peptidase II